jgi:hypothetical protein
LAYHCDTIHLLTLFVASAQQEEDEADFSVRKAKAEEEIQKQTLQLLQSHASDVSQEFNDAKEVFQKTAKKGG